MGIFLRLHLFDSQIVGGDELHAVRQAAMEPYSHILTHFNQSDNCIPLTIYYKFLLETTTLSEWGLHSLQIISGILALFLFPLLLKSLFRVRVIAIFLFLLAFSPLLIFYSRFGRPYIIVALLSFVSIFAFCFWIKTKKVIFVGIYWGTAVLAPYFNLISFPAVAAPLVFTLFFRMAAQTKAKKFFPSSLPKLKYLFLLGLLLMAGIAGWFLPAYESLPAITSKVSQGSVNLQTLMGTFMLFSGSFSPFLSVILGVIFIYGLSVGIKKDRFLFGLFLSVFLCQVLSIIIIKPDMVQSPLVLARYSISCLTLWLLVIAFGLEDLYSRIKFLFGTPKHKFALAPNLCVFLLFASILFTNPMIRLYLTKSNFTSHHDFINPSYKHLFALFESKRDSIPQFYLDLKKETDNTRIIEAPPMIVWAYTCYHLYQQIHNKRVAIGYSEDLITARSSPFGHKKIKFRNYLNLDNTESIAKSGFTYVVIHHDILEETLLVRQSLNLDFSIKNAVKWEQLEHSLLRQRAREKARVCIDNLRKVFGKPYFEDEWITVFRIT